MSRGSTERVSIREKIRIPVFMGTILVAFLLLIGASNSSADTGKEVDNALFIPTPDLSTPEAISTLDLRQVATATPEAVILEPVPYAAPYFDGDGQRHD